MSVYSVEKMSVKYAEINIPASKSIFARTLILAARAKNIRIRCGELCEDQLTLLTCLEALGVEIKRDSRGLLVHGHDGQFSNCSLNVKDAGTVARFLPAILAFSGGEYFFDSSAQMKKRPMDFKDLENLNVSMEYLGKEGNFPFRMRSQGITGDSLTVCTDKSTQFASAFLLAASFLKRPFTLHLTGQRTESGFISLTLSIMERFCIPFRRERNEITVFPQTNSPALVTVEADLSCASYFCALAFLCGAKILIKDGDLSSPQTDLKFLRLLEKRGLSLKQTENGILADGEAVRSFEGFDEEFTDFSDQALTAAALAPFAATPSRLKNIGHIRFQECDRLEAAVYNLHALGVPARSDGNDLFITPSHVRPAVLETFGDHRVAMAFSLVGLKSGNVQIKDPGCCKKTFANYFEILNKLTLKSSL